MPYHSVAEIYEAIDEARARLLSSVEALTAGQHSFRPDPARWSIADIIEHLSLVEGQIARLLHVVLAKAEAAGVTRPEGSESQPFAAPVSIDEHLEPLRDRKLQSPDKARPSGTLTLSDSLIRLKESRAALHNLRPRLERIDGAALRYPHPVAGPINAYQWLLFVGSHEDRHRRQIEALKQSPGFTPDA